MSLGKLLVRASLRSLFDRNYLIEFHIHFFLI
jgi:hypothetical protein